MSGLEILAVIGVIGLVIYQQLIGQSLRGKRVVLLPAILTVVGFTDLTGSSRHLQTVDIVWLAIGAGGSIVIGLGFGAIMRLESRDGALWAKMPVRGLWLWVAMVAWRGVISLPATAMHAHVAASSATLLFALGLNRLAQAAVIVPRAMASGIPFAPEKDGRTFMAGTFERGQANAPRTTHTTQAARATHHRPERGDDLHLGEGYDDHRARRREDRSGHSSLRGMPGDVPWDRP